MSSWDCEWWNEGTVPPFHGTRGRFFRFIICVFQRVLPVKKVKNAKTIHSKLWTAVSHRLVLPGAKLSPDLQAAGSCFPESGPAQRYPALPPADCIAARSACEAGLPHGLNPRVSLCLAAPAFLKKIVMPQHNTALLSLFPAIISRHNCFYYDNLLHNKAIV